MCDARSPRTSRIHTGIDQSLPPAQLIADAVKRSPRAHLFHFYPVFCELAASPRRAPVAFVAPVSVSGAGRAAQAMANGKDGEASGKGAEASGDDGEKTAGSGEKKAAELDARALVKECLKQVGREMGVGR